MDLVGTAGNYLFLAVRELFAIAIGSCVFAIFSLDRTEETGRTRTLNLEGIAGPIAPNRSLPIARQEGQDFCARGRYPLTTQNRLWAQACPTCTIQQTKEGSTYFAYVCEIAVVTTAGSAIAVHDL